MWPSLLLLSMGSNTLWKRWDHQRKALLTYFLLADINLWDLRAFDHLLVELQVFESTIEISLKDPKLLAANEYITHLHRELRFSTLAWNFNNLPLWLAAVILWSLTHPQIWWRTRVHKTKRGFTQTKLNFKVMNFDNELTKFNMLSHFELESCLLKWGRTWRWRRRRR